MAFIKMNRKKLRKNFDFLNNIFKQENIEWAAVTKLLCGNESYLREVINLGIKEICDARISNLAVIKKIDPSVQTVYIKPPAKRSIEDIVRYADASFNTEYRTIKLLSEEAQRQNKTHKIIIMIEMGDLREGIMGDHLIDFYKAIFELPNIKVTGLGTNLNCLYGVLPSPDKLIQLCLYQQLIEAQFNKKIKWVTGGTSVVVPMLLKKQLPKGVNHFRIGETLFFGNDLVTDDPIENMEQDVFKLYAEIIEITEKPKVPIGTLEENPSGERHEINEEDYGKTSFRAILDLGLLDMAPDFIISEDESLEIVGASSDMLVVDIDQNEAGYQVGDLLSFRLKYMGALRLFSSDYIDKFMVTDEDESVENIQKKKP